MITTLEGLDRVGARLAEGDETALAEAYRQLGELL